MRPYYEQDGCTIYLGDCRDVLPSVRADVVITDPPYGIGFSYPGATYVDTVSGYGEWLWPVMEAHRLACVNYGKPAYQPNKGCYTEHDESGQLVKHVLRTSWGIGVNLIRKCDGWQCDMRFCEFVTCHECGGDFCEECWPKHDAKEDCTP